MKNKKNIIEQKQSVKTLEVLVKLNINSMEASSKEPIGPTLGQYGLPINDFCNLFNNSSTIYEEQVPLRAHIYIYTDKTFELTINIPTLYYFLKSSLSGLISLAPEDIKITVSLVEVQPSESIRFRVLSVAD